MRRPTDCITLRQFRSIPYYCDTLRPIGVRYQTVVTLDIPGKIGATTVLRDKNSIDAEGMLLTTSLLESEGFMRLSNVIGGTHAIRHAKRRVGFYGGANCNSPGTRAFSPS
jgi:hypothetical protein